MALGLRCDTSSRASCMAKPPERPLKKVGKQPRKLCVRERGGLLLVLLASSLPLELRATLQQPS
jgi:hypothetical protein